MWRVTHRNGILPVTVPGTLPPGPTSLEAPARSPARPRNVDESINGTYTLNGLYNRPRFHIGQGGPVAGSGHCGKVAHIKRGTGAAHRSETCAPLFRMPRESTSTMFTALTCIIHTWVCFERSI